MAKENTKPKEKTTVLGTIYDVAEMISATTIFVMLMFAFLVRLNIVDGNSMLNTLHNKEYLIVSDLCYTPKAGDIVVVHKINAAPYNEPIVKRVIAVGGQTVDIDFATWTLRVDGEVVDEPYRYVDSTSSLLTAEYPFPITVPEGEIFVMGDNRNHSADSRQEEIQTVDERCIVGHAVARIYPLSKFGLLKNPFDN